MILYLLILFAFISINSCSKEYSEKDDNKREKISIRSNDEDTLSDEQIIIIKNSKEFKNYFKLKDSIIVLINKAIQNGASIENIRNLALESLTDSTKELDLYIIVFGNKDDGVSFLNDFSKSKDSLFNKFPELISLSQSVEIDIEDQINYLFDNFSLISNNVINGNGSVWLLLNGPSASTDTSTDPEKPVCGSVWNQVKLSACALGCGVSTGGVGTLLCGWGCWCTFCSKNSTLADGICAD